MVLKWQAPQSVQKGIAMAPADTKSERLLRLRNRTDCLFVERDEFCRLMIGSRRLVRADESAVELRGLLDLETGTHFLIEQYKLEYRTGDAT